MWLQRILTLRVGACFNEGQREFTYFCRAQSMTYDLWLVIYSVCRMTWHVADDLSLITHVMWHMFQDPWPVTYGLGRATYLLWFIPYHLRLLVDIWYIACDPWSTTDYRWPMPYMLWRTSFDLWRMTFDRRPTCIVEYMYGQIHVESNTGMLKYMCNHIPAQSITYIIACMYNRIHVW